MRPALLVALACLLAPAPASAKRHLRRLHHIVLDPGHGGENKGTAGAHGVYEKYLTLPIALALEGLLLEHTDATVTLTRREDRFIGLRERTRVANQARGDLLLSIHLNSGVRPEAHGLEVYFLSPDSATEEIAHLVSREEGEAAGAPAETAAPLSLDQVIRDAELYRAHADSELVAGVLLDTLHARLGAPRRGVFQAPFAVLKEATMPAVVVEVGFLSHAVEGKHLTEPAYQKRVAQALYRALLRLDEALSGR